jgi:hypothetical protein
MDLKVVLQKYKDLRSRLIENVQEVVNLRNKMSFVSTEMLQRTITTVSVKSSRVTFQLHGQIDELCSATNDTLVELSDAVCKVKEVVLSTENRDGPVDSVYLACFKADLEQQYFLESGIVTAIIGNSGSDIDQDSLTTMIACFEYPPYLADSRIDTLLQTL